MEAPAKKIDVKAKVATDPAAGNGASGVEAAEQAGASVEKIRDILFGPQIKNYESRFTRLEETVARESADLKETMKRRFESLEGFFRKETESLTARLKSEREERTDALRSLSHDLKSSTENLAKKIQELDNKTAEGQSGLRRELMSESRKLADEIRQRTDELTALLEKRIAELREDKASRATVAALLADMAVQLTEGLDGGKTKTAKAGKDA
ncbi:MAG: hypothetical protein ACR2IF_14705 [Terriglobales bacterium]